MLETIYLISRAKPSGPINQALNILVGLNKIPQVHAILVTLAPEKHGDSWLDRFSENGIEIVQFNQPLIKTKKCISLLKKLVRERHVDVVHSSGFRADFVNMHMRGLVKTVSTQRCLPNEIVEKFPKITRRPFEFLHLRIIMRMDCIVGCSKSIQKAFVATCNCKVDVVQNGVNTLYFTSLPENRKLELRRELGIPERNKVYLVLGVLLPRKNINLIIGAFQRIDNKDVSLIIVGSGSEEGKLRLQAGNDKRITFTGSTGYPLKYLQASDILIASSLAEGLPNTVLEALSCGLPCILSDIDPHKEIFEDKMVGIIFNRFSEQELADTLKDSLKWNLSVMSQEARSLAEEKFGLAILAQNYYNIYMSLK